MSLKTFTELIKIRNQQINKSAVTIQLKYIEIYDFKCI